MGSDVRKKQAAALFIGDINVDIIMGGLESSPVPDREITCRSFNTEMGSSAVIAAAAYSALGGNASFLGLAGNDEYGDFMVAGMQSLGIDTSRVLRTDAVKTGVTLNLIQGRQRTQVTYPGTIAAFDGSDIDRSVLSGIDHLHFAGPYQQERFRPHIAGLLAEAHRRGMTTSLDPQWDQTERWEYMDQWMPELDYLFVNEDEAMSMTGTSDAESACRALCGGVCMPLVKMGGKGAMLVADGSLHLLPPVDVPVTDTTGAGDNFDAGFLHAVLNLGSGPMEAVMFANAAASRSCMFVGGIAAHSTCEDIYQLMKETA